MSIRSYSAFHGTGDVFDEFDLRFLGSRNNDADAREAFFFTDSEEIALCYAYREEPGDCEPVIMEVDLQLVHTLEVDLAGAGYRSDLFLPFVLQAKSEGYDGVIFRDVIDGGEGSSPSTIYAVFDPGLIKIDAIKVAGTYVSSPKAF